MANPKEEVQNALTPEEKPIIENIISLFQQLLSMQDAQAGAQGAVQEAMGEEMEEVDVNKAVTEETGDSKAEERIDNVTPTTDQSLQDLNKSIQTLTSLLTNKKPNPVRKNLQPVKKDQTGQALGQIAQLMTKIVQKQDDQEKLNAHLFEALGFTDDVVKKALPQKSQEVQKDKPIQSLDSAAVIKDVLTEVFKNVPALNQTPSQMHPFNRKSGGDDGVRKNLKNIASYIHGTTGR